MPGRYQKSAGYYRMVVTQFYGNLYLARMG